MRFLFLSFDLFQFDINYQEENVYGIAPNNSIGIDHAVGLF